MRQAGSDHYFDGETARAHQVHIELDRARGCLAVSGASLLGEKLTWSLSDIRALREQADREVLVLTLASLEGGDLDALPRLVVSDPELAQNIRTACPELDQRSKLTSAQKTKILRNVSLALGAVLVMVFIIIPGIARVLADNISIEREVAFGKSVRAQIDWLFEAGDTALQTCRGEDGQASLDLMVTRLTAGEAIEYDLDVTVVDHELINAFALPGGQIVFFRGLIDAAENADEVAAVLAHEIAHVVHRDPTREAFRAAGSVGLLGLLFGDFAGGAFFAALAETSLSANYSQAAELKADSYAHALLEKRNVSPAALGQFFERLREEYGDVDGFLAHLSSHPRLTDRIHASSEAHSDDHSYAPLINDQHWADLQAICADE